MKGKCLKCDRYHPKAVSNCRINQSVGNMERQKGLGLTVSSCKEYTAIKKKKEEVIKVVEPTVDEGCTCEGFYRYGICDCESEG